MDELSDIETMQLIMGSTYSLKSMMLKLSPPAPRQGIDSNSSSRRSSHASSPVEPSIPVDLSKEVCFSYLTSKYRLIYFESMTGWKICLLLEPNATLLMAEMEALMRSLYLEILVKGIIQNPMYRLVEPSFERSGLLYRLDSFISNSPLLRLLSV